MSVGEVILDQALVSTSLHRIVYSERVAALWVRFTSGAVYRYDGVPAVVVQQLLQAGSPGRFFAEHVRKAFPGKHVQDDLNAVIEHVQAVSRGQRFVLEMPVPFSRNPLWECGVAAAA